MKTFRIIIPISIVILLVYIFAPKLPGKIRRFFNRRRSLNVTFPSAERMHINETNKFRLRAVYRFCKNRKTEEDLSKKTLRRIIVDDQRKVLYCQVPKVASTNWNRIFYILARNLDGRNPLEIDSTMVHKMVKFDTLDNFTRNGTIS